MQNSQGKNGYAVPRLERGMVYVNVHPDEGMELKSLFYVMGDGEPVNIPKTGDPPPGPPE